MAEERNDNLDFNNNLESVETPKKFRKKTTSFTLDEEALGILDGLAKRYKLSRSHLLNVFIKRARKQLEEIALRIYENFSVWK